MYVYMLCESTTFCTGKMKVGIEKKIEDFICSYWTSKNTNFDENYFRFHHEYGWAAFYEAWTLQLLGYTFFFF